MTVSKGVAAGGTTTAIHQFNLGAVLAGIADHRSHQGYDAGLLTRNDPRGLAAIQHLQLAVQRIGRLEGPGCDFVSQKRGVYGRESVGIQGIGVGYEVIAVGEEPKLH